MAPSFAVLSACAAGVTAGVVPAISDKVYSQSGQATKEFRTGADKDQAAWQTWFEALPLFAQDFDEYEDTLNPSKDYDGSLESKGHVAAIEDTETSQMYVYDLKGLDPACNEGPDSTANSCGVHVHEGSHCETAGGHWWNKTLATDDPWTNVAFNSTDSGNSEWVSSLDYDSAEKVDTKLTVQEVSGKSFVIHDKTGARVACSPMDRPYEYVADNFTKFESGITEDVEGHVKISGSKTGVRFIYRLKGFDTGTQCPQGIQISVNPDACGLVVHLGPNCSSAGETFGTSAQWPHRYIAGVDGVDTGLQTYAVETDGIDVTTNLPASNLWTSDGVSAVVIVYSHAGAAIACSPIKKVEYNFAMTAAPATAPPPDSLSFNVRLGLGFIVASLLMFIA